MMKRILDFVCSIFALLVLSPLMILIIGALAWTTSGKPFFLQKRSGFAGKAFVIIKFRTMRDSRSKEWNPEEDLDRLTPLGRILREYSLDELPQLINVILGQMSLVGPRPLPVEYDPMFSEEQRNRFCAKPGITGWAQVNGRNLISWEEKFQLDNWYVKNQSLQLDFNILLKSVHDLFVRRGINKNKNQSMPKFTGSKI